MREGGFARRLRSYGGSNTEYRTETESYSRIVSYGAQGSGPSYWKVWSKSGQIMEYGVSDDSRIEAQGKTEVMLWALNKVSDTVGNYLTVTYTEDNANGQYYPVRIDYAGNSNTGRAPTNSIQFTYEARPDVVPTYVAGSLNKNTVRMSKVQSYAGTTLTREYRLAYEQSVTTRRTRLTSFTECEVGGVCLSPTSLQWTGSLVENFPATKSLWLGNTDAPSGQTHNQGYQYFGDFNGDGKTDYMWNYNGWYVALSNGHGFEPPSLWLGNADAPSGQTHAYDNLIDGNRWYLGRLRRSSVTSVTP